MFSSLNDLENYEERKVSHFEENELIIDTCKVSDGKQPYETAIIHPNYNNGDWIIVEAYDTKKKAQDNHDKWVKIMTADNLPNELTYVCNSYISQLCKDIGIDLIFKQSDNKE